MVGGKLPSGTEVWAVADKRRIGKGVLSPRTVKALALLEANRVLLWSGYGSKGGGIYNYDPSEDATDGRALMRLSHEECIALHASQFIEHYQGFIRRAVYGRNIWGELEYGFDEVIRGWVISVSGKDALQLHDKVAHVKRKYHDWDKRMFGWDYKDNHELEGGNGR